MTHFVRVVDGKVKDVWDTPPAEGVGNNGWRNAVEIHATLVPNRQAYTAHRFDLNTDPVQIIWDSYDITVEDRRGGMKGIEKNKFQQVVSEQTGLQLSDDNSENYDGAVVEAARQTMLSKLAAIDAATTHDELDALL
jgi:hypothetical protein